MKSMLIAVAVGVLGFVSGLLVQRSVAAEPKTKAAYLIAGWNVLQQDRMKPFGDAVVPLAKKAGFQMMAAEDPQVLEGQWPYSGIVILQKYDSMQALKDFWYSSAHAEAKKLREGLIDSHFVIAVEARD